MQANAPQSLPQPEEVHLQDYINVIRRRRWTFFITFLTVFTGIALYTFLVSPLYEATATLHIKDQKSKSGILGELALSEVSPIDSEIEILKSRTNVEQVVKQAHLDWQVKRKSQGLSFKLLEFTSTAKASKYRIEVTGNDTFNVYDDDEKMVGTGKSGTLMKGDGITLLLNDLRGKAGDGFRLKLLSFQRTVQRLRNNLKAVE